MFAAPGTIEVMHYHASPAVRAAVWDRSFPGQIPEASVVATTPQNNTFKLEGNELPLSRWDTPDTDKTTVLHVPPIGLVVAGDSVYNRVHQYLVETGNRGLEKWIRALEIIAALQPQKVVASHKNPALDDDPKHWRNAKVSRKRAAAVGHDPQRARVLQRNAGSLSRAPQPDCPLVLGVRKSCFLLGLANE